MDKLDLNLRPSATNPKAVTEAAVPKTTGFPTNLGSTVEEPKAEEPKPKAEEPKPVAMGKERKARGTCLKCGTPYTFTTCKIEYNIICACGNKLSL